MTIYKALSLPEQIALQREVEELRADAARYRWIRNNPIWIGFGDDYRPDEIDAAVRYAMNKEQPK